MNAGTEHVWRWLAEVPDPEIPVISVVDLGIIRNVAWDADGACVVSITPTYSGCPAMLVISESIEDALKAHGIDRMRLETRLSPAWTTDWMTDDGKQKLRAYGIAPPMHLASGEQVIDISRLRRNAAAEARIECPNCGSSDTRLTSQFGSTPCKALYSCSACREPFDYFKSH
jgi:ring-1,2-phenylacetyl-CoA epoxidase subunit PaaD